MATGRDLLLDVTLPPTVWRQSGRPFRGTIIRWSLALTFVAAGLAYPVVGIKLVLLVAGVGLFFAVPAVADSRLSPIEREVMAATKHNAARLLGGLEQRQWVALFAPHAWVALQKARLHLVAGDGRAAARALSECARMCNDATNVSLLSGQARALMLAGDRKDAREILGGLSARDTMSARDRLDYGTVLLGESGRTTQAREAIEEAADALGDHPQALAALAIVRARDDAFDDGASLLARAELGEHVGDDPIAQDLIKKARKALRPALKGGSKKRPKRGSSVDAVVDAADTKGTRRNKKDRRRDRRIRRKAARVSGKQTAVADSREPEAVSGAKDPEEALTVRLPASRTSTTPVPQPSRPEVSETAPTIKRRRLADQDSARSPGPDKPATLFGSLSERVSMFKPPPLPGAAPSGAPRVPPPPKVGPPPKVARNKGAEGKPADDDWGDALDGDDPPMPLEK